MTREVITADPQDSIENAAQEMYEHKIQSLPVIAEEPVVDEASAVAEEELLGIITSSDVMRALIMPQEAFVVHGAGGEGDRLLGGVLRRGDHRKAAGARRLDTLPLEGASIPTTMSPIDGSSKSMR